MPGNHNLGDMRPRKTESTKSYCYKKEMSAIFYLARMSKQIILEDVTTLPHCTQNSQVGIFHIDIIAFNLALCQKNKQTNKKTESVLPVCLLLLFVQGPEEILGSHPVKHWHSTQYMTANTQWKSVKKERKSGTFLLKDSMANRVIIYNPNPVLQHAKKEMWR